MKKNIAVVALDPLACTSYCQEVESLFGDYAKITGYSVRDGSATGMLPRADLYVISTDAYGSAEEVARHVPIDSEVVNIEVTFRWDTLDALLEIPAGTPVLFVNVTKAMAREAITQLSSLGINHLHLIPYFPGAEVEEQVEIALTPGESRYVPDFIGTVHDCGHRPCSYGMMIEIALRLGMEYLLETEPFLNYAKIVASNHYSFDLMFARSRRQESQFHILMEILNEGLIGVTETGEVFACNKKACQIARVSEEFVKGKRGEEVFPYIPFYRALKEKQEVPERIVRIYGINVSVAVIPVMQRSECIGAFATLQRFNEQESRQNALRRQLNQKGHYAKYTFEDVIGESEPVCQVKAALRKMAATESPILIVGETGTGKELMAHAVHRASRRAEGPFVAINVAAMPENLLESELFGYEEGAFTGAKKGGRPGLFEFAHQGTLFLDEVEGMSLAMQVKLLRVLQEGEVMRVGGSTIVRVNVRIVAATNESLEDKVEDGSFRRDLYYRLNALTGVLPPLRERGEDIFLLLDHFRRELGGSFRLSDRTRKFLMEYPWPGNIRELHNAAEYFCYMDKQVVEPEDLPPTMSRWSRGISRAGKAAGALGETFGPKKYGAATSDESFPAVGGERSGSGWEGKRGAGHEQSDVGQAGGERPGHEQAGREQRERLPEVLLELLYEAEQERRVLGREKLLAGARERGISCSQKQVRELLQRLEARGLVSIGRGRGGSRITTEGIAYWETTATNRKTEKDQ